MNFRLSQLLKEGTPIATFFLIPSRDMPNIKSKWSDPSNGCPKSLSRACQANGSELSPIPKGWWAKTGSAEKVSKRIAALKQQKITYPKKKGTVIDRASSNCETKRASDWYRWISILQAAGQGQIFTTFPSHLQWLFTIGTSIITNLVVIMIENLKKIRVNKAWLRYDLQVIFMTDWYH